MRKNWGVAAGSGRREFLQKVISGAAVGIAASGAMEFLVPQPVGKRL
jgi:hypothetical protein